MLRNMAVRFVSIGGGEPLEWSGLFETLNALKGVVGRSFTSNGLPFLADPSLYDRCAAARPDNIHLSIHFVENPREVERVVSQVKMLERLGLTAGVNLLVRRKTLEDAKRVVSELVLEGLCAQHLVLLAARGTPGDTPSPREVADVACALNGPFQSMSCLRGCGRSERFASIGADRTVAWCSYTRARRALREMTFAGLTQALDGLDLLPCELGMPRDSA